MIHKIKCFFGWHEWGYVKVWPEHEDSVRVNACIHCGDWNIKYSFYQRIWWIAEDILKIAIEFFHKITGR